MSASLKNKSVIVTGGSKGIGKGIARVFAQHGAKVLVVARTASAGEAAVAELVAAGGTASFFQADVSKRAEVEAMIADAVERYGGLDVLCANAGAFPALKLADMTDEAWDGIFVTNVRSMMLCVQAAVPVLRLAAEPRIVVTSSITGPITGFPGWSHYGATKAAQLGFIRTAAIELAKDRITINAVLPGNILTEALAGMGADYLNATAACVPLGKLGTVEDIGHAAAFLASAEAGYITGQTITVDGGQILPESPAALTA
ncbi:MAG: 3-oxoacyl-ACP reductase FabG [Opitutaceae bacterium]|jgi:3-oxoacyl-[acyl-carrier protein] reductase